MCDICLGVEYIVSDRIFDTLPTDEQKLWHSHDHEVFLIVFFVQYTKKT